MDKKAKYCEYCGGKLGEMDEGGWVHDANSEACKEDDEVASFCPYCGDRIGEETIVCSCDKPD